MDDFKEELTEHLAKVDKNLATVSQKKNEVGEKFRILNRREAALQEQRNQIQASLERYK